MKQYTHTYIHTYIHTHTHTHTHTGIWAHRGAFGAGVGGQARAHASADIAQSGSVDCSHGIAATIGATVKERGPKPKGTRQASVTAAADDGGLAHALARDAAGLLKRPTHIAHARQAGGTGPRVR